MGNPIRPLPVIAVAVIGLCAWALWVGRAPLRGTRQATPMPDTLGLWAGRPLDVDDRTLELLETAEVRLMEYRLGKEPPVWFAEVAGFGNRAAFHLPEIYDVGSRFEMLEREPITVFANGRRHRLMRLVIAQDDQRFEAWYWFTANGRITPSYSRQQLWLMADSIRREPASGTLVRISTPLDAPDITRRRLLAFVTALTAEGPTPHRRVARHGV